jgi:hypothetical protein
MIAPGFQRTFLGQKPSKTKPQKPKKDSKVLKNGNYKRRNKTT